MTSTYTLFGSFKTNPGKRNELIDILTEHNTENLAGCLEYRVFSDKDDPDAVWVFEQWTDESAHKKSLEVDWVKQAIQRAMPLIAGFGTRVELESV